MSENSNGRWEFDESGNVHYVPPEEETAGGGGSSQTDGQYRYSFKNDSAKHENADFSGGTQSSHKRKGSDTGWHWIFIILGFMIWWPIGLVLLFLEIFGKWPGDKKVEQEFHRVADAAKNAAKQFGQGAKTGGQARQTMHTGKASQRGQAAQTAYTAQEPPNYTARQQKKARKKAKKQQADQGAAYGLGHIKAFRVLGGIMTGLFGFAFVMELIDELTYFIGMDYLLQETVPLLALCLSGVALLGVAGSRDRKLKRFRKYVSMIGNQDEVSISALAKAMGVNEKKAARDLEEMLERGVLESGYIDAARQVLVLREGGIREETPPAPEPDAGDQDDTAAATLKHIRSINDAIANPELSAKIDRIEELTAKIFRLLEERPEKAGELRQFMNYYLPQTLKILENYSKLEAQGIEGENIAEAKQKIEGMMDKLVDGYETQLDKLFADDVLDISADLKVMESMLEKDGLAGEELKF